MYLRHFLHPSKGCRQLFAFQPRFCFSSFCQFEQKYEKKKLERYAKKTGEIYTASSSQLISQIVMTDVLVPNFFTNQLTLQKFKQKETPTKKINYFQNSYSRFTLPLSTNRHLREKLNKLFDNEVRLGRIFELMDSIAGIVSYTHCFADLSSSISQRDMICVTGAVEELHLFSKIDIAKDLIMEGYLNYVGKTSMEIEINVIQQNQLKANSLFTMVARDSTNPIKGYVVPELTFQAMPDSVKQKALVRHQIAKQNVVRRKVEMANSYDKKPPTYDEIAQVHSMFLDRKHRSEIIVNTTPIAQTVISICKVMHTQNRNVHGKVFGGFLIREMIELAWVAGCKYAQDFITMQELTNIYFKKPVDIGSRLTLKAMVTFVEGSRVVLTVQAYTSKFTQQNQQLACYLHLVGRAKKEIRKVHPESYEESLQYLSSRKAFQELFY